ncbi:MAG: DMT family transporter [Syntrophomonadaceae bacterium]|nr:DMT family transporter [Syntrophomonadaceae bacterium]MDD3022826.1 DMT family transporter [Syntrophomonadaceae bacterium]
MPNLRGMLCLAGAFMMAGSSIVAARFVSGSLEVFTIAAVSLLLAMVGLLHLCLFRLKNNIRFLSLQDWLNLMMQAIFGIFLFRLFLLKGLTCTSAGEAGILTGATPALTAILAGLLLKEPIYKARILGITLTVTGIILIQTISWPGQSFTSGHFLGNLLVLCAAGCEALFNILSKLNSIKASATKLPSIDPVVQTTLVAGMALLLCLWPARLEHPILALSSLEITAWLALIWYGLFVTALGFILWYAGIRRCDASVAAAFSGMMPLTALLLAVFLLGEDPHWQQWSGGFMVVLGMLLTGLQKS